MKRNKQGISLIVLVLTIIIMIILAAAVIVTLSNSNIIDRADEAVSKTDVAQLQQLASIAWAEAYARAVEDGTQISAESLKDDVIKSLEDNGYSEATLNNYDIKVDLEGVTVAKKEMSKQKKFDQEFLARQEQLLAENNNVMPESFIYGDYEYAYNKRLIMNKGMDHYWSDDATQEGWGVKVLDYTKKEYGPILTSAFGKPIKSLSFLYSKSSEVEVVPNIPNEVVDLQNTFFGCTKLVTLPEDFTIPNGVTNMSSTFSYCENLTRLPSGFEIPSNVNNLLGTFGYCRNLTGTIVINTTLYTYSSGSPSIWDGTTKPITLTTTSSNVTKSYLETLIYYHNNNVTVDPAIQ